MHSLLLILFSPRLLRPLFWLLALFSLLMALLPPSILFYQFGDKFNHMLAFSVLTLVARLAWPRSLWVLVVLMLLYGAAIEGMQTIPALHRDADLRDWVVDGMAIACGALLAQFLIYILPKRDTN